MSERREMWETFARLLHQAEKSARSSSLSPAANIDVSSLEQEVRKLGKTQFKANALAEEQVARLEKALDAAVSIQEQNNRLIKQIDEDRSTAALNSLLEAILPALDGVDNAIASGKRYLQTRDLAASKVGLTPAQTVLVSPADRAMLAGWLDGLRLVRQRLLAILETGGVTTIPTVGEIFDPYRHVVVGTTSNLSQGLSASPGMIVSEERAGYSSPHGVIRYAEVVVYQAKQPQETL